MSDFAFYFNLGLDHVLDINGFDHALFIIALTVPFAFKQWKTVLLLLTLFTIGHTISLLLSIYEVVVIKNYLLVELLLQLTILATALYNFVKLKKSSSGQSITVLAFTTLFFGIIHGFGFSRYLKMILGDTEREKLFPLLEFALGIEVAHIIVAVVLLIISYIVQNFFRFSKRDWILVASAFVVGVILPILLENEIW